MVATIAKHFTFPASHQLPNHDGPCARLHGHTYKLEIMVTDRLQPEDGRPQEGMVLDFAVLKRVWEIDLEPKLDHQHLNDSLGLNVPTSENIAWWIWDVLMQRLSTRTLPQRIITVRLWESPSSYAEIGPAPWRGEHS